MRISALIIDDSRLMRRMLIRTLRKSRLAEFRFVEAATESDALALCDPAHTDVVFVDAHMPSDDGIRAAGHLRAMVPHIPLVLVVSEATDGALLPSWDACLAKPFTVDGVRETLGPLVAEIARLRDSHPNARPLPGVGGSNAPREEERPPT